MLIHNIIITYFIINVKLKRGVYSKHLFLIYCTILNVMPPLSLDNNSLVFFTFDSGISK